MVTEAGKGVVGTELVQIVESVFAAMMNLELRASGEPWFADANRLTSVVHLAGDWNGALMLECNRHQACRFTCRFLSIEPDDAAPEVVRDVIGELANMIGGNLKCILSKGIQLSMPTVVDGSDYFLRVCGAEVEHRFAFQCTEGVFWVTVLTRDPGEPIPVPV
jgi:chemotaxis protein CheX